MGIIEKKFLFIVLVLHSQITNWFRSCRHLSYFCDCNMYVSAQATRTRATYILVYISIKYEISISMSINHC